MYLSCSRSFEEIFRDCCWSIMNDGSECGPRGMATKEMLGVSIKLLDPRSRLVANPIRNANYGFSVGEFLWYVMGKNDVRSISYYNKRMPTFSDDGMTLRSAYGKTMFIDLFPDGRPGEPHGLRTQWRTAVKTLVDDPDSRRAVIVINQPYDNSIAAWSGSKDVPCTLALQFFVRGTSLHMHVTMRSNDLFWGLTSDLFSFTLMQELMMLELREASPKFCDLQLGEYIHTDGSLHIYERHYDDAARIAGGPPCEPTAMEPITSIADVRRLCDESEHVRCSRAAFVDELGYSGALRWMACRLNEHKKKRLDELGESGWSTAGTDSLIIGDVPKSIILEGR